MSYTAKKISTDHKDLIQDISYDFFGRRVATASLDQTVKIWNINENNEWILKDELKIMPGLLKVAWAHPEFGQLIAVAHDKTVWFFEENCSAASKSSTGWTKLQAHITDAKAPITDIKFAPKYIGLQLAICTSNGEVKMYECRDILSSNTWTPAGQDMVNHKVGSCSACSWSTCFSLPILLAVGVDDPYASSKLHIWEYNDNSRSYAKIDILDSFCQEPIRSLAFAPSVGKLYHTLAIASKSLIMLTLKPTKESHKYTIQASTLEHGTSTWRVCWNTVGSVLASAGDDRKVKLWKCNYLGVWRCFAEVVGDQAQRIHGMDTNDTQQQQHLDLNVHQRSSIFYDKSNSFNTGNQPSSFMSANVEHFMMMGGTNHGFSQSESGENRYMRSTHDF